MNKNREYSFLFEDPFIQCPSWLHLPLFKMCVDTMDKWLHSVFVSSISKQRIWCSLVRVRHAGSRCILWPWWSCFPLYAMSQPAAECICWAPYRSSHLILIKKVSWLTVGYVSNFGLILSWGFAYRPTTKSQIHFSLQKFRKVFLTCWEAWWNFLISFWLWC